MTLKVTLFAIALCSMLLYSMAEPKPYYNTPTGANKGGRNYAAVRPARPAGKPGFSSYANRVEDEPKVETENSFAGMRPKAGSNRRSAAGANGYPQRGQNYRRNAAGTYPGYNFNRSRQGGAPQRQQRY